MLEDYVRRTMSGLTEPEAQGLVVEAYQDDGWTVENVHKTNPRFEEGADIVAVKNSECHLIAVKKSPGKADLDQVKRLAERAREGKLIYVHLEEPTEPFRKEMSHYQGDIKFLGPIAFHKFLIDRETVSYLPHLFSHLLVVNELAVSVAQIWACRNVEPSPNVRQLEDAEAWWRIKDAVLKVRASLGVLATRWEDRLMSKVAVKPADFEPLLDEAIRDLDYVQRYAGGQIVETFIRLRETRPDILSILWRATRMRTYWIDFAGPAERMSSEKDVIEFARRHWIVPGSTRTQRAMMNLLTMRFFYSSLAGTFRQLAEITSDFDHGVELAWKYGGD